MKSIAHFVVIGGAFLHLLLVGCAFEASPPDVVNAFYDAVAAGDKETALSLIADYPEKQKRFASSSTGRYLEKPKASRKTYPRDVLDFHVIGDTAVVLVHEQLSERDYDIDPIYLVRTSSGWKIAPGVFYPLLYGDATTWGGDAKLAELKTSMLALQAWKVTREAELHAYFKSVDDMKNAFEL